MTPITFIPGTLVVLVGPSASGKSTFAARYPATWNLCLDTLRGQVADDEADQSATLDALRVQHALVEARLSRGLTTLIADTNLAPHVRGGLLSAARFWGRPAHAVLFGLPLAECEKRNANRARQVPTAILRQQYAHKPTAAELAAEGFDHVHHA
ncbi:AAA family ATPase [Streptomyces xiamenensis]|uniref:AAA family ATPase n=1 Tax=Streptomyces xiamenensis TaxID=408015 RepID=UPI0035DA218E